MRIIYIIKYDMLLSTSVYNVQRPNHPSCHPERSDYQISRVKLTRSERAWGTTPTSNSSVYGYLNCLLFSDRVKYT